MALKVFWTDTAKANLRDIFDYYSEKADEEIAQILISSLIDRTRQLETQPDSGTIEPLLQSRKENYRYLVEGHYKLIYWTDKQLAYIATVFDVRQNPEKIQNL